ncbi:MAG TPA: hypothetical protein VI958_07850 [Acidobacteriota bacterium]
MTSTLFVNDCVDGGSKPLILQRPKSAIWMASLLLETPPGGEEGIV